MKPVVSIFLKEEGKSEMYWLLISEQFLDMHMHVDCFHCVVRRKKGWFGSEGLTLCTG